MRYFAKIARQANLRAQFYWQKRISGNSIIFILTALTHTCFFDLLLLAWRKSEPEWIHQVCPCSCENVFIQTAGWEQKPTQTQRGCRQSAGPGSGPGGGRPDWLLTRLAGGQGLSGGPGIITCEWLSHFSCLPSGGVGELRQAWRGGPCCHRGACLLCFIINYCAAGSQTAVSAATSSVRGSRAPASWGDVGQVVLLTAFCFGCPLIELQLWEQRPVLLVLLRKHKYTQIIKGWLF